MHYRKSLTALAIALSSASLAGLAHAQSSTYNSGQSATDRQSQGSQGTSGQRAGSSRDGSVSAAPPNRGSSAARGTEPSMNPLPSEEAAGPGMVRNPNQTRYNADPDRIRLEQEQQQRRQQR